ncbi:hypothetical protein CGGC5_v005835 [Colletotrichum fructicola Nara gc5]|uniref:Uncharacterized protein n=1 Tax=Colletotrichum fructicola (strain Nara gc5) TaxID=1213859 RepID=A0A7J6J8B5_COLFN|nr:hypothetical protein CGGC5_v005835 [Colletotrichum fructicola Nara gc5]
MAWTVLIETRTQSSGRSTACAPADLPFPLNYTAIQGTVMGHSAPQRSNRTQQAGIGSQPTPCCPRAFPTQVPALAEAGSIPSKPTVDLRGLPVLASAHRASRRRFRVPKTPSASNSDENLHCMVRVISRYPHAATPAAKGYLQVRQWCWSETLPDSIADPEDAGTRFSEWSGTLLGRTRPSA